MAKSVANAGFNAHIANLNRNPNKAEAWRCEATIIFARARKMIEQLPDGDRLVHSYMHEVRKIGRELLDQYN